MFSSVLKRVFLNTCLDAITQGNELKNNSFKGFRHLSFHPFWRFSQKKNCSQLDHKIIIIIIKKKSIFLPIALSALFPAPTGSAAEDLRSPARPAACAGCWLCSEAPCCIQWCEPLHRRPHPSTWTNGSSAETLLQTTNSDQSLTIKPWLKSISNYLFCLSVQLLIIILIKKKTDKLDYPEHSVKTFLDKVSWLSE